MKKYKIEDYLILINNRYGRKMLAKLRCSNHCLLIETGRHDNTDVSDHKCTLCDKIEDEKRNANFIGQPEANSSMIATLHVMTKNQLLYHYLCPRQLK